MGSIIEDIVDIGSDIIDGAVDLVEDVISWIIPMPDIPDFSQLQQDLDARGVLVNKKTANGAIPIILSLIHISEPTRQP